MPRLTQGLDTTKVYGFKNNEGNKFKFTAIPSHDDDGNAADIFIAVSLDNSKKYYASILGTATLDEAIAVIKNQKGFDIFVADTIGQLLADLD